MAAWAECTIFILNTFFFLHSHSLFFLGVLRPVEDLSGLESSRECQDTFANRRPHFTLYLKPYHPTPSQCVHLWRPLCMRKGQLGRIISRRHPSLWVVQDVSKYWPRPSKTWKLACFCSFAERVRGFLNERLLHYMVKVVKGSRIWGFFPALT